MNRLLVALFSTAVLASGADPVPTPAPDKKPAALAEVPDPVEQEYERLLEMDDRALREVERIIKEANAFTAQGAPAPASVVAAKLEAEIEPVRKKYNEFLDRHPKHIEARLAYGSFLNEIGETQEAIVEWERVREMAPKHPAAWNNLANIYGHIGPVRKAFHYYERAIELNPKEPVYLQNLATTVYLFRKDAAELYRINEEQVFNKALDLYRQALKLEPENFILATDLAQSYYGIKPLRTEEALEAWRYVLKIAKGDLEKQGVYLHLARVQLNSGLFQEAETNLAKVSHPDLQELKKRLDRNLREKRGQASKDQPLAPENGSEVALQEESIKLK